MASHQNRGICFVTKFICGCAFPMYNIGDSCSSTFICFATSKIIVLRCCKYLLWVGANIFTIQNKLSSLCYKYFHAVVDICLYKYFNRSGSAPLFQLESSRRETAMEKWDNRGLEQSNATLGPRRHEEQHQQYFRYWFFDGFRRLAGVLWKFQV